MGGGLGQQTLIKTDSLVVFLPLVLQSFPEQLNYITPVNDHFRMLPVNNTKICNALFHSC